MRKILLNTRQPSSVNYKKFSALVDDEDFEKVSLFNWCVDIRRHTIYAKTWIAGKLIYMHDFISGFVETDHRFGNGLDNRRSNLRPATRQQNQMNKNKSAGNFSSKYKGVHFRTNRGRWQAQIVFNDKKIYLGNFLTEAEAAIAYNKKAIELFGRFAKLNIV